MICTWKEWTSANMLEKNHFICYMEQPTYTFRPKWWTCFPYRIMFSLNLIHHFRWISRFTHVLIVPGEEYYKNKVKEIPCVDHGGKWHIAAYWCSFTTKFKNKNHCWVLSIHKNMKTNTKKSNYVYKKKEHILSLGLSTIIYCTNLWQTFA